MEVSLPHWCLSPSLFRSLKIKENILRWGFKTNKNKEIYQRKTFLNLQYRFLGFLTWPPQLRPFCDSVHLMEILCKSVFGLLVSGHIQLPLIMRNQGCKINTFLKFTWELNKKIIQTSSRVSSVLVSLGVSSLSFTFFTCSDTLFILSVPLKRCRENNVYHIQDWLKARIEI